MASVNQCNFIGNTGKDPETRYGTNGDAITNFSIACSEKWKNKSTGEMEEKTEWVRCVAFGKLGEIAGEYLAKGKPVYISGRMQTRKWENKEGVTQYTTEIVVDRLQLLGKKGDSAEHSDADEQPQTTKRKSNPGDVDDDIPFN